MRAPSYSKNYRETCYFNPVLTFFYLDENMQNNIIVDFFAGVYISVRKRYLFPPPSENDIFSPSRDTSFFDSHRGLFSLILQYFAFILPFYFPFSHFLSPFFLFLFLFFLFLFPFFLFLLHFPPFSLRLFVFFSPK